MMRLMGLLFVAAVWLACPISGSAQDAQTEAPAPQTESSPAPPPPPAKSLSELLDLVEKGFSLEREENRLREERFRKANKEQAALLKAATVALGSSTGNACTFASRFAIASAISRPCFGVQTAEALMHDRPALAAIDDTIMSTWRSQSSAASSPRITLLYPGP